MKDRIIVAVTALVSVTVIGSILLLLLLTLTSCAAYDRGARPPAPDYPPIKHIDPVTGQAAP